MGTLHTTGVGANAAAAAAAQISLHLATLALARLARISSRQRIDSPDMTPDERILFFPREK